MIEKTKKLNVTAQKQINQIKIGLIGDSGTGKSSFMSKLITGQYKSASQSTLGVESGSKTIQNPNGTTTNITIWDFSGKLDFVQIRNEFYKQVDVLLLFCDLTSKSSAQSLEYWLREAKDNGANAIYIVGNKLDAKKINDMQKVSKQKGCSYFEVSAKTGEGIQELMKKIISEVR